MAYPRIGQEKKDPLHLGQRIAVFDLYLSPKPYMTPGVCLLYHVSKLFLGFTFENRSFRRRNSTSRLFKRRNVSVRPYFAYAHSGAVLGRQVYRLNILFRDTGMNINQFIGEFLKRSCCSCSALVSNEFQHAGIPYIWVCAHFTLFCRFVKKTPPAYQVWDGFILSGNVFLFAVDAVRTHLEQLGIFFQRRFEHFGISFPKALAHRAFPFVGEVEPT